jgi:hypothetical protein
MNWFSQIFGFEEKNYEQTRSKFLEIFYRENSKTIQNIGIGDLIIFNNYYLKNNIVFFKNGYLRITNIIDDIRNIHRNYKNSTIQVASQLNCLEMINPFIRPENGITIYSQDNTQGPICSLCCPAGLAYRNYIYNGGQTYNKQICLMNEAMEYLTSIDNNIKYNVSNGYLNINDNNDLIRINNLLDNHDIRDHFKGLIKSGSHRNQEVIINGYKLNHNINHVYCSGIPINYNVNISSKQLWSKLSIVWLEAMYENTLLIAYKNNSILGRDEPCFLTKLGGGVFGMEDTIIINAIHSSINFMRRLQLYLDVYIVHYGSIDERYNSIK